MGLTLTDVRRIASDVAERQHPTTFDVVGVTPREGSCRSAEVILVIRDSHAEPYRAVIGVSREASEGECRAAVSTRLGEHLAAHAKSRRNGSCTRD
jgi:hypothetical protein